jgi:hypothetical protein
MHAAVPSSLRCILLASAACGFLTACAGSEIRYDRPIPLNGLIEDIAACTMQKMTEAGFGPPGLTYVPVRSQPRSYILLRSTPAVAPAVGVQLLRIDFEQTGRTRAEARISPAAIGGATPAQAAVAALDACQSGST